MRYCGKVGYAWTEETSPGIYSEKTEEKIYCGDVLKLSSRWENTERLNNDINLNNQFSIIADPFAFENFAHMKFIEYLGTKWKIVTVEVQRPRLILTIGGVYNGE